MSRLKSSFELAMERTIITPEDRRYREIDDNEYYGYEYEYDNKSDVDFVKDWQYPVSNKLVKDAIPIDLEEDNEDEDEIIEEDIMLQQNDFFKKHESKSVDGGVLDSQIDSLSNPEQAINKLEVHWGGNFLDYGGFARLNRSLVFGLSDRDVVVKTEVQPYINDINNATKAMIQEMSKVKINPKAPKVVGVTMPMDISHPGYKIIFTMIETSDGIHNDYVEKLNLFNEIWVPSHYAKSIFEKSGVRSKIYVIPLGVDVSRYKPSDSIMDFGQDFNSFKFLSVFKWSYRKGYDILLKSYLEEFSSDEDVSMLLVSRSLSNLRDSGTEKIIEDFQSVCSGIGKSEEELPHVALYSEKIPEFDMPKVYNACDCFTLISRGEGFGLPYCEAAACGLPVIASNCTGQTEFLKEDNSYLINPEGYAESNLTGHFTGMAKMSRFYEGQKFPVFNENSIKKIRKVMRCVYENKEESRKKAEKLRSDVVNNFRWDQTVDKVLSRLRDIYEEQKI